MKRRQRITGVTSLSLPCLTKHARNLSSSNAAVASLPVSITIPKGQLLATFQVTTSKPTVATSVTLLATTGGLAKSVVLKVSP